MAEREKWPAGKVVRRRVAKLVPSTRNARRHSEGQIEQLAASIKRWGWTMPVLIDETGGIIAGHGRVEAAKRLGILEVPCMIAEGWSDEAKRAYLLADNKLGLNSSWDDELLAAEIADLKSITSLDEIGFSVKELGAILQSADTSAQPPQLGDGLVHRLIVDCKDEAHQAKLMEQFAREGLTCRPLIS
jgi:ParB-like chromosome segregation protein Spo0J